MVSRTLKDIEAELPADRFLRVHASHLVALPFVVRYVRGNGGYVVLPSGEQLPVSRAKRTNCSIG
ncbi:MAG: LytTR family transcriptional regulator [Flavobacteriales bacterium]|nr:LytTR family transcriptional regulator [Flavobacteriales bacterium]